MKKFRYSLQRVLDARDAVVSQREAHLAAAQRELQTVRQEIEHVAQAVQDTSGAVEKEQRQAKLAHRECVWHRAWFYYLNDRLHHFHTKESKQQRVVTDRREKLRKALVDVHILESMSRRERQQWMSDWREAERKDVDEAANNAFLSGLRDGGANQAVLVQSGEGPR